ncbi:MAG: toprim domain-containing protein [Anaerolineae bacterium]|nr:toprim domain-containing protein [Anaerolineae bacterium]
MSLVDDIKRGVCIGDVAAQYGELRRRGRLQACRCLCGENQDRNPSFMLYEDDNHFHCFACRRHGSVIDLVMLVESLDFKGALYWLRDRYLHHRGDVGASQNRPTQHDVTIAPKKHALSAATLAILRAAVEFYQQKLRRSNKAQTYLHHRGLSEVTIERMQIGFADGGLGRNLSEADCDLGLAARMGLLSARGELMQGRIVFPVLDETGQPVWLIGRALNNQHHPKYLGLPDGLVHKQPMRVGRANTGIIVVEGPMDLAALMQWRLDQDYALWALLGTGTTTAMTMLLQSRPKQLVFIALDQDKPGQEAATKLSHTMRERGIDAKSLTWPHAKDCGELLQMGERGRDLFMNALA